MLAITLKELEDLPWFPELLRNYQTDFVGFTSNILGVYKPFVEYLKQHGESASVMKDLGSGSGAPAISVFENCVRFEHLLLTDKYPRELAKASHNISYSKQSCDVMDMFFSPGVCYTMFNAFHHFTDEEKCEIINRIRAAGSHAYFVEILEPTARTLAKVIALTTVGVLLFTPFIRPVSVSRLFFTYVIPVNVCTIAIDGIISVKRSKCAAEYRKLFAPFCNAVKVFQLQHKLGSTTVIEIVPQQ